MGIFLPKFWCLFSFVARKNEALFDTKFCIIPCDLRQGKYVDHQKLRIGDKFEQRYDIYEYKKQ